MFFERPVDTTFSSILVDFGLHFGRVLGAKIGKNTFRRGSKKRSKKKSCGSIKSHAGVYKPGGGSLTSTHPGVPRPPSGASEQGRLTHYDHTTACLEGTVADFGAQQISGLYQDRFLHNALTRWIDPCHPEGPGILF